MAYVQRLIVRFNDVDYAQLVYYPKLFSYCHWVFEDFFQKEAGISYAELLTQRRVGFPVVNAKADFRAPFRFGDVCRVVMELLQIGRKSITTRYRLFQGDTEELGAEIEIVAVAIDMGTYRSVDVPDYVRQPLLKHLASPGPSKAR